MKKIITGLFFYSLLTAGCVFIEVYPDINANGYKQVIKSGITTQWQVNGSNLNMIVSAPTTGWIAVGFDPSLIMKDANIIIGYVLTNSQESSNVLVISDEFGTDNTVHTPDTATNLGGVNNIIDSSGIEANGITEISFTIPLNSGDIYDTVLIPGNVHRFIIAFGLDDGLTNKHIIAASFIANL